MSKIFGVPLVLFALIFAIVVPVVIGEVLIFRAVDGVEREVKNVQLMVAPAPEAEIEEIVEPTATPTKKVLPVKSATPSAEEE
jgi:hypothetical protein